MTQVAEYRGRSFCLPSFHSQIVAFTNTVIPGNLHLVTFDILCMAHVMENTALIWYII